MDIGLDVSAVSKTRSSGGSKHIFKEFSIARLGALALFLFLTTSTNFARAQSACPGDFNGMSADQLFLCVGEIKSSIKKLSDSIDVQKSKNNPVIVASGIVDLQGNLTNQVGSIGLSSKKDTAGYVVTFNPWLEKDPVVAVGSIKGDLVAVVGEPKKNEFFVSTFLAGTATFAPTGFWFIVVEKQ